MAHCVCVATFFGTFVSVSSHVFDVAGRERDGSSGGAHTLSALLGISAEAHHDALEGTQDEQEAVRGGGRVEEVGAGQTLTPPHTLKALCSTQLS